MKWMARIVGVVALSAVLSLIAGAATAETVKVGVIAPFSGGFARWGEQFQQAQRRFVQLLQARWGNVPPRLAGAHLS